MIRPMSAFSDFREELGQLLEQARKAGIDNDQLADELREHADSCEDQYRAEYERQQST